MDQLLAHQRAQAAFAAVLAHVDPAQLTGPTPCENWDVKALIDHVVGGNQWVLERAGLPPIELPDDLLGAHAASAAAAQAVFAAPDGMTRLFELPFGTLPGAVFIGIRASDVFTHTWDLAKAIGQPTALDPELAAEALAAAKARISPAFRGPGRPFAAEQPCPQGATTADELAAFLGRDVTWATA